MTIQMLIKLLEEWAEQSNGLWSMTRSRAGLSLALTCQHSNRRVEFRGKYNYLPEESLIRSACIYVTD